MNNQKLGNRQAMFLIVTLIINNIVFSSQNVLLNSSAPLINSIYISLIAIGLTLVICMLFKKFHSYDILDISNYVGGKILTYIIGTMFFAYFLFIVSIVLRKLSDSLEVIYYPVTNIIFISILFVFTAALSAHFGENGIVRAGTMLIPFALATVILIDMGNMKYFHYTNIYPLLGDGAIDTFLYGLGNLFVFSGLAYIFFIPPTLKDPSQLQKITLLACITSSIFLIIAVANIVFLLNNQITGDEFFPLYVAVRYIEFGLFFQRLDSIFLLFWITAFIAYLGIILKILVNIFKKMFNLQDDKPPILPISLAIFATSIIPYNNNTSMILQNNVSKIMFFSVFGISLILLIWANIKKR